MYIMTRLVKKNETDRYGDASLRDGWGLKQKLGIKWGCIP
jgi:hypothetical protein